MPWHPAPVAFSRVCERSSAGQRDAAERVARASGGLGGERSVSGRTLLLRYTFPTGTLCPHEPTRRGRHRPRRPVSGARPPPGAVCRCCNPRRRAAAPVPGPPRLSLNPRATLRFRPAPRTHRRRRAALPHPDQRASDRRRSTGPRRHDGPWTRPAGKGLAGPCERSRPPVAAPCRLAGTAPPHESTEGAIVAAPLVRPSRRTPRDGSRRDDHPFREGVRLRS